MDDDEDDPKHFHTHERKTLLKDEDDEKMNANINKTFGREKAEMISNRRGVRIKFDDDRVLPVTQTMMIKTEPCFTVTAIEDPATKSFYQNKLKEYKKNQLIKQRNISEADSLEDEYSLQFINGKETSVKSIDSKHIVPLGTTTSLPLKSILKKTLKKEEEKVSKTELNQSLRSRSSSRSSSASSKRKHNSSTRLDFNEVQHLAEITAKQTITSPSIHCRSLFDQTINIFDPNNSYRLASNTPRPSRLQYYIKPYRGEPTVSTSTSKSRSRSLPRQSRTTVRSNHLSTQYAHPSTRKQHISWSPAREYFYDARDYTLITPIRKERTTTSDRINSSSLLNNRYVSLSNPCLHSVTSLIPIPIHYQASRSTQIPSPPLSTVPSHIPSTSNHLLKPFNSVAQYNQSDQEAQIRQRSEPPDIIHQDNKEHGEKIQRYDRLLEKMRQTDEQLESLSRSWMNNENNPRRISVSNHYLFYEQVKKDLKSNLSLNKTTSESHILSPLVVQLCLIILIILNLLVVYFFQEINVWWSENIAPGMIVEQQKDDIWNF